MKVNYGMTESSEAVNLSMTPVTFTNFALIESEGGQCVITNTTSPLGRPEQLRFNAYPVDNIYKGTGITEAYQAPDRTGVRIVANVHETWSLEPSAANEVAPVYHLPVSAQVTLAVPNCEYIAGEDLIKLAVRAISSLFDTGTTTSARLESLIRGALVPTGVR